MPFLLKVPVVVGNPLELGISDTFVDKYALLLFDSRECFYESLFFFLSFGGVYNRVSCQCTDSDDILRTRRLYGDTAFARGVGLDAVCRFPRVALHRAARHHPAAVHPQGGVVGASHHNQLPRRRCQGGPPARRGRLWVESERRRVHIPLGARASRRDERRQQHIRHPRHLRVEEPRKSRRAAVARHVS